MFTGIILAKGQVASVVERGGDLELGVDAAGLDTERVAIGDSICVQGACLTVTRKQGVRFFADVSRETMAKTTLGKLSAGAHVNLEPSLRAGDALGGHLVSGHVDALGTLQLMEEDARAQGNHVHIKALPPPVACEQKDLLQTRGLPPDQTRQ